MQIDKYGVNTASDSNVFTQLNDISPIQSNTQNSGSKTFASMLKDTVDEVNARQKVSEQALADMATGQIKDLHQAAIAIGKAENSMKLMLEVRNKAISAYKELIRTQI